MERKIEYDFNLIGHEYKGPMMLHFNNGSKVVKAGDELEITEDSICQKDIHYFEVTDKSKVLKGTRIRINYYWRNFYGCYINFDLNGKNYDIKSSNFKFVDNE